MALAEPHAASTSLLSQRPAHPTHRPGRARPRGPSRRRPAAVGVRNGCPDVPAGCLRAACRCSAACCWSSVCQPCLLGPCCSECIPSGCSGAAGLEAPWPGLIAWPASLACCASLPPSAAGHARRAAIAWRALTRLAGLHPLRISPYARAAGSRDATVFSVTLRYNTIPTDSRLKSSRIL